MNNLPDPQPPYPLRTTAPGELVPARRPMTALSRKPAQPETTAGGMGPAFLLMVWQQWWKVVVPSGIALAAIAAFITMACFVPKYQATAFMVIGREPSPVGRDGQSLGDDKGWVETQVQTMLSPVVLTPVLSREGIAQIKELANQDDPVAWMSKNLTVQPRKNSGLYEVQFVGSDPKDAAAIVNAIVGAYLDQQGDEEQEYQLQVVQRLNKAMGDRLSIVESLQKRLVSLSRELGAADPFLREARPVAGDAGAALVGLRQQLAVAEVEYERVTAELSAAEALKQKPQTSQSADAIALEVDVAPAMLEAKKEVAAAKSLLAEIDARAKPGAKGSSSGLAERRLKQAEAKAAETRKQLAEEIAKRRDLDRNVRLQERISELKQRQANAEAAKKLLAAQSEDEAKKRRVTGADSASLELVRAELAREEKVVDLIGSSKLFLETGLKSRPNIAVKKLAEPPAQPIEARPIKLLGGAGLIGLVAPFGLAVLWERLVRRINHPEQLAQDSSFQVIGEIVQLPSRPMLMRGQLGRRRLLRDVSVYQECIDSLRTGMRLAEPSKNTKVIAVTSATSGEGKTSLASQLGVSIARATGARVLLIDGDMRSPGLHTVMQVRLSPGLAEVLSGSAALDEAIVSTGAIMSNAEGSFSLLPAGRLECSPHQLVGGPAFEQLIEMARERFDYIIIDTPPVLCASESLVIAKAADGALLCALYDVSRSNQVRSASERITRAGANVIGAVLAGMPLGQYSSRYGHYGYGSPYIITNTRFMPNAYAAASRVQPIDEDPSRDN